jgi:hypothetical protein
MDYLNKGKKGRPRKLVRMEGDIPIEIHTSIAKRFYDLVPEHVRWKDLLEQFIIARFSDPKEAEIEKLQDELDRLDTERAKKKVQLDEKLKEKKRKEDLQKSIEVQRRYCAQAFRTLVQKIRKSGDSKIRMPPEVISRVYGISFNLKHASEEWDEMINIDEWSDIDLIEKFDIRKESKGEREDEIMKTVMK